MPISQKTMNIAVTGASGHIGNTICRELICKGHHVKALIHNDEAAIKGLPVEIIRGDVLDIESLKELMKDCDAVFHTAGMIGLGYKYDQKIHDINVQGTRNVLNVAKTSNINKLVHFSSIHIYQHTPQNQVLDETRQFITSKSIFYDQTKKEAHIEALKASLDGQNIVIVCPTSVIGPFDFKPSKIGQAVKDIYNGKIPVITQGGFDFVDVRDVAFGAILALEKGQNGETYILGGKYHSLKLLSSYIFKMKNKNKSLLEMPVWIAYLGIPFIKLFSSFTGRPPILEKEYLDILLDGNRFISSRKAIKELGYKSRALQDTISDMIVWYQDNNLI